jgi:hypothetical protein
MSEGKRITKRRKTVTTLPELKSIFTSLRKGTIEILKSSSSTKERITKFKKLWFTLMHSPVEPVAAEAYLRVMETGSSRRNSTRKAQKGGAAAQMSGAPLDFQTRPGIDGVHGSFPQYLTGGLSFYDTVNQQGMFKGCGTENITPIVPESISSNKLQGGGGVLDTLSDAVSLATTRPFVAQPVPSTGQLAVASLQGMPPPPSREVYK